MLADSLFTAQGKVGSRLKVVLIGTLAPMAVNAGHWWHDLINDGSKGRTHVQHFKGDLESWDRWPTIRQGQPANQPRRSHSKGGVGRTGRRKVGLAVKGSFSLIQA